MKIIFKLLLVVFFLANANIHARETGDNPYRKTEIRAGAVFFSLDDLNSVLKQQGQATTNIVGWSMYLGETFEAKRLTLAGGLTGLLSKNNENKNTTSLSAVGPSLEIGYRVCGSKQAGLYPYAGLSYMFAALHTQQQSEGGTLASVYEQSLIERSFNRQEFDLQFGLSGRFRTGKETAVGIRCGYRLCVAGGKWKYSKENINFPSTNLRGWNLELFFNF
ncbi:MAG: hypothetical protein LBD59_12495 [Prevotellaceae bacterium]|jgi:hypothetical protein|nr:hypothetical protein [Prevotellaceae bacterium]